jgi:Tol biopolymer transport system component
MVRWYLVLTFTFALAFNILIVIVGAIGHIFDGYELAFVHCDLAREHCGVNFLDVEHGVILARPLEGTPFALDWSPEGSRMVISQLTMDGAWTYLYDTDGSIERFQPHIFATRWLSENRLMVQTSLTEFRVYDFLTADFEPTLYTVPEGYNEVFFAELSPNGQYYAASPMSGDASGTLQIVSINNENERLQINNTTAGQNFAWSPNSQQIIYTSSNDNLNIYVTTIATGDTRPLAASEDNEYSARWSYDGSRIAFFFTDINFTMYHLNILNVNDGSIHSISLNSRSGVQISFIDTLEWSPDDRYLLVQPFVGGIIDGFHLVSTDGTDNVRRLTAADIYNFPAWRP